MGQEIQEQWDDEWVLRSVGLFLISKKNLPSWFFKKIRMTPVPVPVPHKERNSISSSGKKIQVVVLEIRPHSDLSSR
jgi:hypothetical protein